MLSNSVEVRELSFEWRVRDIARTRKRKNIYMQAIRAADPPPLRFGFFWEEEKSRSSD